MIYTGSFECIEDGLYFTLVNILDGTLRAMYFDYLTTVLMPSRKLQSRSQPGNCV